MNKQLNMSTCKLYTFVSILCFVIIRTSADISLAKTLHSQENYKNSTIYFDHESQMDGALNYMFCHRSKRNMSCTIFREEHYVNKLPRISPCNVTFELEHPSVTFGPTIRLLPLNPNKTLILWVGIGPYGSGPFGFGTANKLKYTLVDYNTCKTTEITLSTNTKLSMSGVGPLFYPDGESTMQSAGFACYDKRCDISFHDLRCGVGYCIRSIDKNTGQITTEADFYYTQGPNIVDVIPKNPRNSNDGVFFFDWKDGVIYKFFQYDLVHFPNDKYVHEGWEKFRYSVRYGIITICKAIEETKIKCDQIDFDGTIKMKKTFDLQKRNLAPVPYTLRGGGFLLLTTECNSNCTEGATNHIYIVDAARILRKVINIKGLKCKVDEHTHWHTFFENEEGKICVSLLCYDSHSNTPEELQIQCYSIGITLLE